MLHAIDRVAKHFLWVAQMMIVVGIIITISYAFDRDPPFRVIRVQPAAARAGEFVTIDAEVMRQPERMCSAEFSRYIYDSTLARWDIGSSVVSAEMIEKLESSHPGRLRVSVKLPDNIAPGQAHLDTVLVYRCNAVHRIWPIDVTTALPFTVLP